MRIDVTVMLHLIFQLCVVTGVWINSTQQPLKRQHVVSLAEHLAEEENECLTHSLSRHIPSQLERLVLIWSESSRLNNDTADDSLFLIGRGKS